MCMPGWCFELCSEGDLSVPCTPGATHASCRQCCSSCRSFSIWCYIRPRDHCRAEDSCGAFKNLERNQAVNTLLNNVMHIVLWQSFGEESHPDSTRRSPEVSPPSDILPRQRGCKVSVVLKLGFSAREAGAPAAEAVAGTE